MICVDLITESGQIFRIECPRKHEDNLHRSIENAMKRRDWWSPRQFEGCTELHGLCISRINMGVIVAEL